MSNKTLSIDDRIYDYLCGVSLREPKILTRLRQETMTMEMARMQIGPEQGQFMALLVQMLGAKNLLEVGVFTGYSTLACALALPKDGTITALDLDPDWPLVGLRYWQEAGVAERIDLRIGDARQTLQILLDEDRAESYDFMFIDADKTGYIEYYEFGMQLLRPGGVIAIDNVLWDGQVADPGCTDEDTLAIRALNEHVFGDKRVDLSLVPIGDGLTLARKRD
ncbi:MAG: class I SAM-dependent methyltransferase [Gammaproteobacteria bacterium]